MSDKLWAGARVHLTEVDPGTGALCGNVGLHVGDQESLVRERRRDLAQILGRDVVWMDQTHSTRVELIVSVDGRPTLSGAGEALIQPATGEGGPVDADGVIVDARGWEGSPPCMRVGAASSVESLPRRPDVSVASSTVPSRP